VTVRDAATVIVLREDPLQIYMMKRHSKSGFMANAWVYPGGGLDENDLQASLHERCDLSPDEAARRLNMADGARALGLYLAAIRETFEESGLLLARRGEEVLALTEEFADYRTGLQRSKLTLGQIAEMEGLNFPVSELNYFAHWITPTFESRRYNTRFFTIRAPDQTPTHDKLETTEGAWVTPEEALRRGVSEDWFLAPPTVRTLEQLRDCKDLLGIQSRCTVRPPCILPHLKLDEDTCILLLPGDPEFPNDPEYACAEPVDDHVTRMVFKLPNRT